MQNALILDGDSHYDYDDVEKILRTWQGSGLSSTYMSDVVAFMCSPNNKKHLISLRTCFQLNSTDALNLTRLKHNIKVTKTMYLYLLFAAASVPAILAQTPGNFDIQTSLPLDVTVQPGDVSISPSLLVPQKDALKAPTVLAPGSSSASTYLILMIDPFGPFLHWLQPSLIPTSSSDRTLHKNNASSGSLIGAEYVYPLPPAGTGAHDYVVLLYSQPSGWQFPQEYEDLNPPASLDLRMGFDVVDFVEAARLGEPIGANYFRVINETTSASSSPAVPSATSMTTPSGTFNPVPATGGANAIAEVGGLSLVGSVVVGLMALL